MDIVGDPEYVHLLQLSAPPDPAFEVYAKAIEDRWQRGQLQALTSKISAELQNGQLQTAADAKRELEQSLLDLSGDTVDSSIVSLHGSYLDLISTIAFDIEHQGDMIGVPTGINGIDQITGGLRGGQLIILAGTPGSGKTSLAMNMVSGMALDFDRPVLFFSLEMSDLELTQRIISSKASIPYERIRDRKVMESDWDKIARLRKDFDKAPLHIIDDSDIGFLDIKSYAYQMRNQYEKPPVIVVDYLQLMNTNTGDRLVKNLNEAIGSITRGLKVLAGDLDTPIIVLSQLTKQSGYRDNKRPRLGDLRDSGSIGQDADMVIFTYRDDTYYPHSGDQSIAEIIVEKHRAGRSGTIYMGFIKQFTKFVNLADPTTQQRVSNLSSPSLSGVTFGSSNAGGGTGINHAIANQFLGDDF